MGELTALHRALRRAIGEACGDVERPADIARHLSVDAKLASRLHAAVQQDDVACFASLLPPFRGLDRVHSAVASRRSMEKAAASLRKAIDQLQRAVENVFGERWQFDAAFAGFRPDSVGDRGEPATDLANRQAAFRAAAEAIGYFAEADQTAHLFAPASASSDRFDMLSIRLKRGLRRLLPGRCIPIHAERARAGQAHGRDPVYMPPPRSLLVEPGAAAEAGHGPLLSRRWSRPHDLRVRSTRTRGGLNLLDLPGHEIGLASECDVAVATLSERVVPRWAGHTEEGDRTHFRFISHVRVPIRRVSFVLGIDDDRPTPSTPEFSMIGGWPAQADWVDFNTDALNVRGRCVEFGAADHSFGGLRLAALREMIDEATTEVGWSFDRFRFWLYELDYPLVQTSLCCRLILPQAPGDRRRPAGAVRAAAGDASIGGVS